MIKSSFAFLLQFRNKHGSAGFLCRATMTNCASNRTAKTRILIVSDTHSHSPAKDSNNSTTAFRHPLPRCDIFIHAGDMTNYGQLDELAQVVEWISEIEAEVKIVIAGNHDMSLDAQLTQLRPSHIAHLHRTSNPTTEEALALFTSPTAVARGITYLHDETRTFTLASGARFTVHGSPWQPEFFHWAFNYPHHLDRWNSAISPLTAIPENIDILVTHGPPRAVLDRVRHGNQQVGCPWLKLALERVRPRLHVFGHIHEAHGVGRIEWFSKDDSAQKNVLSTVELALRAAATFAEAGDVTMFDWAAQEIFQRDAVEKRFTLIPRQQTDETECTMVDVSESCHVGPFSGPLRYGDETVVVNGSIMSMRRHSTNPPVIVDLDLPVVD